MAGSSSDSDSFLPSRASKWEPLRASHRRGRASRAEDVTEKIHTLASTLQDTNRNLRHVDQMLGQYRDYTHEQTEAIATLKETLEQSIDQLRSQRLSRDSEMRSGSLSSLYASDLEGGPVTESHRFQPTSPLRDRGDCLGTRRRRSRSASVRFVDSSNNPDQLHSLHQSLRDLSSDQLRLGDDINREVARRNRIDAETKKTLADLSDRLGSQRQESVSERVERRLQELEREMRSERQGMERRQEQLGQMSLQLQEALRKRDSKADETETSKKGRLLRSESEQNQLELQLELERSRRKLDHSEGSREALLLQIDDLRSQLMKAESDRVHLQHQMSLQSQSRHEDRDDERRLRTVVEHSEQEKRDLEKQILELRAQLNRNAIVSEMEELRRTTDRKEREKAQLSAHIEVLTSDLEKREQQQLRMLEQLKEIQSRYEVCERERRRADLQITELTQQAEDSAREAEGYLSELRQAEALRLESEKKREDLKTKAQESVRQWKLKCKKAERDLEDQNQSSSHLMDKNSQMVKEKDELKSHLQSALSQIESLRRELSDVLAKRAQQEEELHCREMRLNESRSQQMDLERDLRETRDVTSRLENELRKQGELQSQLGEDKEHLEQELVAANRIQAKSKEQFLELQETISNLSAIRAELTNKVAEEERVSKDLRKALAELQKQQEFNQEELASASRQVKLEREVHQRELAELRAGAQNVKAKQERNVQELLTRFREERDELESHIRRLKTELMDDKNVVKSQRWQVEEMKMECDKLMEDLTRSEEENTKLRRKCQLMHQELEEKDRMMSTGKDEVRTLEEARQELRDQLRSLETEQESILKMIGSEIDAACKVLSRDSVEKLQAISLTPELQNDPHRWMAETKTKLQWLCEEAKEREGKERKLRRYLQQSREQHKDLVSSKDAECQSFMEQLSKKEQLLEGMHRDKKDLLEKTRRQDEEMRALQDRIVDLEMSTRVALEHLESVPEKLNLLEDFKDLGETQRQREMLEERYAKYREIVGSLQQQLEDSKRRIEEYREEKMDARAYNSRLITRSPSPWGPNSFLSSSLLSDFGSSPKTVVPLGFDAVGESSFSVTVNGTKS
ncbi:centrosomal protein of 128 kDa [Microcaecilia unicolor]|uniref:Centrosomal protein of 128 kDa n=1 Tax=Microcaecilia unicolor TaxID=1415580 RepID=A0A6P7YVT5_9AMPH|nr:centrosomal protein of 128 kDa [Microcaecilia unicolor]